jgi:tetratricopeptide (TPR) repeat protein
MVSGILVVAVIIITNCPFAKQSSWTHETTYTGDSLWEHGRALFARDSLREAAHAFEQALEYYMHSSVVHYFLAEAYHRQGEKEKAKVQYLRTLELDYEFYPAYYSLATLLRDEGEYVRAISLLETAVGLNPYYTDAYAELINLYIETGDFAAAERVTGLLRVVEERVHD